MKAPPPSHEVVAEMRAIAVAVAAARPAASLQLAAFAAGEPFDAEKLYWECATAHYDAACGAVDTAQVNRLAGFARAEMLRADLRRRLRAAVEGLAEWAEPLDAVQALIEPAYARGAKRR